jgi:hypothetical protein
MMMNPEPEPPDGPAGPVREPVTGLLRALESDVSDMTPNQLRTLMDLADFGIVYQEHADATRFYPTRLMRCRRTVDSWFR